MTETVIVAVDIEASVERVVYDYQQRHENVPDNVDFTLLSRVFVDDRAENLSYLPIAPAENPLSYVV